MLLTHTSYHGQMPLTQPLGVALRCTHTQGKDFHTAMGRYAGSPHCEKVGLGFYSRAYWLPVTYIFSLCVARLIQQNTLFLLKKVYSALWFRLLNTSDSPYQGLARPCTGSGSWSRRPQRSSALKPADPLCSILSLISRPSLLNAPLNSRPSLLSSSLRACKYD